MWDFVLKRKIIRGYYYARRREEKIKSIAIIYWSLLLYIIAALVWWFISLEKQNSMMEGYKVHQLRNTIDSLQYPQQYRSELSSIRLEHGKNRTKYIGEGSIFFLFIIIGAVFIYRSIRRQFKMQQQQQNFMMAVTHELKTPISVARLNLETLQKHSLDPEKQKKIIRMTLEETARLNFLTNNILVSSQLEGGGYQSSHEDLDFSALLKDCILDFRKRFPERKFTEQIQPDMEVKGDLLLLQILINNLLENALKYSPRECPVKSILREENNHVQLQIIDEGPGIAENEKKKIFAKFYRIGNESTRTTQGTGWVCTFAVKLPGIIRRTFG